MLLIFSKKVQDESIKVDHSVEISIEAPLKREINISILCHILGKSEHGLWKLKVSLTFI